MRVYIVSDVEGISDVSSIDMMDRTSELYQQTRKCLMDDVNAAVDGAFRGGATEVFVVDGHGGGGSFIEGALDPRATQILAKDSAKMSLEIFDMAFCVGAHAMAGTEKAFLDHTQTSATWFSFSVNGKEYGELGQLAIVAGMSDVPLVMMCGDRAACEEAAALIEGITCVEVKSAQIRNECTCIPTVEAHEMIRAAAEKAVRNYKAVKPYKVTLPAAISVTFTRNDHCDAKAKPCYKRRGRTLEKTVDTLRCHADLCRF